ncbi:type II toxin-antitoxin system RelE/ParE family toxin [Labrys sp. KB_33_2]|uniref:type II toxin-antitoxin system RelE/ParE family toxin n=1 Tax=Labrys sp. KB_33_2 TaxID=3237479 RepID=UPI003F8E162C
MRIVWRESALADVERAIGYITLESPGNAEQQLSRIEQRVQVLVDHPRMGRVGRVTGTRELVVPRTHFVIAYSLGEDVELIRILHGAQQWPPAAEA